MKSLVVAFILNLLAFAGFSQELNCQVSVVNDAKLDITSVEQEVFKQLEQAVFEIMNNTKWTKDNFEVEERINCNIQFQIKSIPNPGTYSGSLQIQSSRPVFNSSYNTTIFNFQDDDVTFTFARNALLVYAPNQFRDNLTSILAFYAYYIIGMDYDSFSKEGGTPYFNEAQNIVSLAQSSSFSGWRSNESGKRNRYWLVDNAMHQLFAPLRECNYEYHRKGLDMLYDNPEEARKSIKSALDRLMKVAATRPNSMNMLNFLQAKSNELKNLFQEADQREKNDIVNLLKRLDPANSSKYQEILG